MSPLATTLSGVVVIEPQVHRDGRGFFAETYRAERLAELGIREEWVQDNHSRSARGVLRGMHFSVGEGQAKLVRCARGAILDVAVDIRRGSPTYGRWDAVPPRRRRPPRRSTCRWASRTASWSSATWPTSSTSARRTTTRSSSAASSGTTPTWASAGPTLDVEVSERDASAPRLREIADELPFRYPADRSSTSSQSLR